MNSLANMKVQIVELEGRRKSLETEINKAGQQYKFGLWAVVIGVFLILMGVFLNPLYVIGILVIVAGGLVSLINANKRAKYQDELENLDAKINKLNSSMA